MLFVGISIVVMVALFVICGYQDVPKESGYGTREVWRVNSTQLVALLALLIMIPGFIARVPANSVGIKFNYFNGVNEETMPAGMHIKTPFDKVYKISTEVQTVTIENLTSQTKDAQYVNTALDVKYRVNSENAHLVFTQFKTLDKMSGSLIVPTTQRILELITTHYNVIDILGEKRSDVYNALSSDLADEFAKYGIEFYSISITDMDAGAAIENAITEEAVAKKAAETAEQKLIQAETEAKQKSVIAQAEQDAAKIEAETKIIQAEAERQANELLKQSIDEKILRQQWIEKWNGEVPTYYGSDGGSLIFNTGEIG